MFDDQLLGRYARLSRGLGEASPLPEDDPPGLLPRMASELAETEVALFGSTLPDEQTEDLFPGIGLMVAAAELRR